MLTVLLEYIEVFYKSTQTHHYVDIMIGAFIIIVLCLHRVHSHPYKCMKASLPLSCMLPPQEIQKDDVAIVIQ